MLPANYDFTILRGTSGPTQGLQVYLADSSLQPVAFDEARLSLWTKTGLLARFSTNTPGTFTITSVSSSQLTWAPTPAETRAIPLGSKVTYELELRTNTIELVYLQGGITGQGGLNDDES